MTYHAFFYLAGLPYLALHYAAGYRGFPAEAWNPIAIFRLTGLPSPAGVGAAAAYLTLAGLLLAAACGRGGRAVRIAVLFLSLWLLGDRYNYGIELAQVDAPLVLGYAILALAGGEAAVMLRILLAFVIFSSGVFKVLHTGSAWLTHDALRAFLELRHGPTPTAAPAAFLYSHPALTRAGSVAALLLELAFPLALLRGPQRAFLLALLGLFFIGVWLLLGHPFLLSLLPFAGAFTCGGGAPGLKLKHMMKARALATILILILVTLPAAAATEEELVAEARKEGTLDIGANGMVCNHALIDAFRKKYPFLRINHFPFDYINTKHLFYHLFESKTPGERMDVFLRAHDKDAEDWVKNGWLADLSGVPGYATRPFRNEGDPHFVFFVGIAHGLAYDPTRTKADKLPKTYDELLEPKWKGKVLVRSPLKGISMAYFTSFVKETRGLGWFRKLGANRPYVVQDYDSQHQLVETGKFPFALTRDLEVFSYAGQQKKKTGRIVKLKFLTMPGELPYQHMSAQVNNKAFHPAAARLFLSFLMSKEAEALLEKQGFSAGSIRDHHLHHPGLWQWDMRKVSGMMEYLSYVAEATRELRDGGAKIEPVMRFGKARFE